MARQYDATVKPRRFNIRDLILKRVTLATRNPAYGKLGPNWEGPYRVINCKRQGSYYLVALDGRRLEHPWNIEHLRKYYQNADPGRKWPRTRFMDAWNIVFSCLLVY